MGMNSLLGGKSARKSRPATGGVKFKFNKFIWKNGKRIIRVKKSTPKKRFNRIIDRRIELLESQIKDLIKFKFS